MPAVSTLRGMLEIPPNPPFSKRGVIDPTLHSKKKHQVD